MRRVFQITVQGTTLVGTMHSPSSPRARSPSGVAQSGGIGVLLLSHGQAPRAGQGDVWIFLAERLSEHGYTTFRIDFPGLGESPGDLPVDMYALWRFVESGGQESITRELISQIAQTFSLDGLVVGGLCSGAINSVYAADSPDADIRGLLLLELPFDATPSAKASAAAPAAIPGRAKRAKQTFASAIARLRRRAKASRYIMRFVAAARWTRRMVIYWTGRMLPTRANRMVIYWTGWMLPARANRRLIDAFDRVANTSLPVLILSVPNPWPDDLRPMIFRSHRKNSIRCIELSDTNHMFTTASGKHAAAEYVSNWMLEHFPERGVSGPARRTPPGGPGPPRGRR